MQLPESDQLSLTRQQMSARLQVAMGGRAAEELMFGEDQVTTGISMSTFTTYVQLYTLCVCLSL